MFWKRNREIRLCAAATERLHVIGLNWRSEFGAKRRDRQGRNAWTQHDRTKVK
jgi:hypothetical protein